MATHKELGAVMAILTAAYPMMSITRPTMDIYEQELFDVPVEYLLDAAHQHVKRCRFFPTISELRGLYDEQRAEEARAERDRAWKAKLETAKREALPKPKARKMLTALTEAASGNGAAIVPFCGRGLKRVLAKPERSGEVGEGMTDEEWAQKVRLEKSVNEEPRPVRGEEASLPSESVGGRGA